MNTQDNIRAEAQKDPAQLEREIDQKRSHIEQIVQELGNKLSPGEMFDRALQMGKGSGGEFASNLGQTIKANPIPALLAATGLIWLYSSSRGDSGMSSRPLHVSRSSSDMSVYRTSAHGSATTVSTDTSYGASATSGGIGDKASSAMHTAGDKLGSLKSGAGEKLHSATSSVGDTAHHAMDGVKHKAHQASDGFSRMLDSNPLAVGALGIAVGALLGALVPRTQKEDELLGEYSDKLTNQAKDLARQGYDTVASATREMTDLAAEGKTGMPQDRASGGSASAGGLGSGSTTAH